jgi:hypothetical protein
MAVLGLLLLALGATSKESSLVDRLTAIPKLQGKLKDDHTLQLCVLGKVHPEDVAFMTSKAFKALGECCAHLSYIPLCTDSILECPVFYGESGEVDTEDKWIMTNFCSGYCSEAEKGFDEKRPDWCPGQHLSPPLIAAIVSGSIVVLAIIGTLIYAYLKNKKDARLNQLIS